MADKFAIDKYADLDSLIHSWHQKFEGDEVYETRLLPISTLVAK